MKSTEMTEREKQLLMSARSQLAGIIDPVGPRAWSNEFYHKVMELMGEIEKLLGYS